MRLTVLILLLANVAVFLWLRWAGPVMVRDQNLIPYQRKGVRLNLLSKPGIAARYSPGGGCLALGPLRMVKQSRKIIGKLVTAGIAHVGIARGAGKVPGYGVFLTGFKDLSAARQARFRAPPLGGVEPSYRLSVADGRVSIFLGLYKDRVWAAAPETRLRALEFQPIERGQALVRERFWVVFPPGIPVAVAWNFANRVDLGYRACLQKHGFAVKLNLRDVHRAFA